MNHPWEMATQHLSNITVSSNRNNAPVSISGNLGDLRCIGVGTDAAVFQSIHAPAYAFKFYADDKAAKVEVEAGVYEKIGDSPFFSTCFAVKDNYLVLSYEDGITLFDCILQGIHIPKQVMMDVDDAREYVKQQSLNPRDIHLKNVLLQNGRAKVIDVSEYVKPGNDYRWEHTKKAYEYYYLIDGKSVPFWLVESVRKWYNQWTNHYATFDDFIQNVLKVTSLKK